MTCGSCRYLSLSLSITHRVTSLLKGVGIVSYKIYFVEFLVLVLRNVMYEDVVLEHLIKFCTYIADIAVDARWLQ